MFVDCFAPFVHRKCKFFYRFPLGIDAIDTTLEFLWPVVNMLQFLWIETTLSMVNKPICMDTF